MDGLWDWAVLDGCFGTTRIAPTDVDGLIERNGCFLFLEAKPDGGNLAQGQSITLLQLSRQPRTVVLVFYGDPRAKTISRISKFWDGQVAEQPGASIETLRRLVSNWYKWADKQPRQPRAYVDAAAPTANRARR